MGEGKLLRRVGEFVLKVLGIFVVLEPIWMLLPFAGFLYGSVLRIETLSRNPSTAWLTHFVFPVLAIGLGGPILALLGLLVFFVGAGQIYAAKLRRSGLVTNGLYRLVRHPQYVALTLFGLGILLTWGRAIAWIGFFAMMWLYYWLAKSEERRCRRLFGEAFDAWRERTSFVFPGDRYLRRLGALLGLPRWPAPLRAVAGLALSAGLCFGSMAFVDHVKHAALRVPYLTATIPLPDAAPVAEGLTGETAGGVAFVRSGRLAVVRGPYRNAAAPGFAERALPRLQSSGALREFLSFLDGPGDDLAVAFGVPVGATIGMGPSGARPGPGAGEGRGPPADPAGPDRVRYLIFRVHPAATATLARVLSDPASRTLAAALIAPVDLAAPEGGDFVKGEVFHPGPRFPAEERWRDLVAETRRQAGDAPTGTAAIRVAGAESVRLVMAKAPILRTRIDPGFAETLLAALVRSERFRGRLARAGAGPELVPVAFPRPGPNWYREHRGRAQVSFFIVLVRPESPDAAPKTLFAPGHREIAGAFTAELDLAIDPPADPVTAIEVLGPARDLEERVAFFLSGL